MKPCKEWHKGTYANGYGRVKYLGKGWRVHRLEWTKVNGPIPEGLSVLHICDNKLCYEIEHLYLGTQKDNMTDRAVRERYCKLNSRDVEEIKDLATVMTRRHIASLYGVSNSAVTKAINGKSWKHLM